VLSVLVDNVDIFLTGFRTTVQLFVISAVLSLILGILLAVCRVSPIPVLRAGGTAYVNVVRSTPLVLVFATFVFAVPKLQIHFPSFFWSAVAALTLYTAAFVCEVVRSGINTVAAGQAEAGRAIGMTFHQVLGIIVVPQAFRAVIAPMASVYIAMLKNTTIAAGFSVVEAGSIPAFMAERGENQVFALIWITIGFLILMAPLVLAQRWAEQRAAVPA
jgi:glutamate transport system permease protein